MIPIFRAKKLDSDEFVIGFLKNCTDTGLDTFWIQDKDFIDYKIDINTLSINFPNMLDSQGNKIFASLSKNGKGGDILNLNEGCGENFNAIALYRYYEVHLKGGIDLLNRAKYLRCYPKKDIKRIGIQQ